MGILIIVNIVLSFAILLAGQEMRKRSRSFGDCSAGFRTKLSMASEEAWHYANYKCGMRWMFSGAIATFLTAMAVLRFHSRRGLCVVLVLLIIIQIGVAAFSAKAIEIELENKYNGNE